MGYGQAVLHVTTRALVQHQSRGLRQGNGIPQRTVVMYDPARDLFIAGEETPDPTTEQTLAMSEDSKLSPPNRHAGQKSIHLPTESEATHQEGDLSSTAAKVRRLRSLSVAAIWSLTSLQYRVPQSA